MRRHPRCDALVLAVWHSCAPPAFTIEPCPTPGTSTTPTRRPNARRKEAQPPVCAGERAGRGALQDSKIVARVVTRVAERCSRGRPVFEQPVRGTERRPPTCRTRQKHRSPWDLPPPQQHRQEEEAGDPPAPPPQKVVSHQASLGLLLVQAIQGPHGAPTIPPINAFSATSS